jgi:hypothetical protein
MLISRHLTENQPIIKAEYKLRLIITLPALLFFKKI